MVTVRAMLYMWCVLTLKPALPLGTIPGGCFPTGPIHHGKITEARKSGALYTDALKYKYGKNYEGK